MNRFKADLQTLELDQYASRAEIRQAYRDLVMVWHPDRFPHNPRLRQKAEAKLKQFNLAYEHLKGWRQPQRDPTPTPRQDQRMAQPRWATSNRTLDISLAEAEFILQRYQFKRLEQGGDLCQYQGGPFVLAVCHQPAEVMISVPCDSLRMFDRILLSIPCKSTGHFTQKAARRLLGLLNQQRAATGTEGRTQRI